MAPSPNPVLKTRFCTRFGVEYPVVQAPMASVGGPALTAAVSKAGGLGVLAAAFLDADQLRAGIAEIRRKTDRPFGVNLLLAADIRPPAAAEVIPKPSVKSVQATLNEIRADLGLPPAHGLPAPPPDTIPRALEIILDERVPVFSVGLGDPGAGLVDDCHRRGIRVMAMVTTAADARTVEAAGVDAVVAQGSEAGGHRSHFEKPPSPEVGGIGGLALIPEVVDAVHVPVLAAGGVVDGRGLVAAIALGADGASMGTRFIATKESVAPPVYKQAVMERSSDATTVTDAFSGRFARAFRNRFSEYYAASHSPVLPFIWQLQVARDIYLHAATTGDGDHFPMWAGQGVGRVTDLPTAAAVVRRTVREARQLLMQRIPKRVDLGARA